MKKIIIALIAIVALISCKNQDKKEIAKDNSYTITGENWTPFEGDKIQFILMDTIPGATKVLAEPTIKDGKFVISGSIEHPQNILFGLYGQNGDFKYYKGNMILESGEITLRYDTAATGFNYGYTITGGKYNQEVWNKVAKSPDFLTSQKVAEDYRNALTEADKTDSIKMARSYKLNDDATNLMSEKFMDIRNNAKDPYARLLAIPYSNMFVASPKAELIALEKELGTIPEITNIRNVIVVIAQAQAQAQTVGVGKAIKNFTAKDLNDNEFHLSNVLKDNKLVLVEFWASWCSPCRAEIPHMKKAYDHYKNKGFEIVSFTLDHKKDRWQKATKQDGIPWINVGDLLAMKSPVVKMYGVVGVPKNYLVDQTGTIVAMDLRQEKLDEKLEELLGK